MELDLEGEHRARAYSVMSTLVTPRPIAWVTTIDANGVVNAAPYSSFSSFGSRTRYVAFCVGEEDDGARKDTDVNIEATGEFVVNFVDEDLAEAMSRTAASTPPGVSELEGTGLTTAPSSTIRTPRIAEAPASLECVFEQLFHAGTSRLIIGTVKRVHVRDELFDPETQRVRGDRYKVVGRMSGPNLYCRTNDRFELISPP